MQTLLEDEEEMKLTDKDWKNIWRENNRRFNKQRDNSLFSPSWQWQTKTIRQVVDETIARKVKK